MLKINHVTKLNSIIKLPAHMLARFDLFCCGGNTCPDANGTLGNLLTQSCISEEIVPLERNVYEIWQENKEQDVVAAKAAAAPSTEEQAEADLAEAARLLAEGKHEECESQLKQTLGMLERTAQNNSVLVVDTLSRLGECLQRQGRLADAASPLQSALALSDEVNGKDHERTLQIVSRLHENLCKQGRDWEAKDIEDRLEQQACGKSRTRKRRTSYIGSLSVINDDYDGSTKLLVISDLGQDNDDEMALLLLSEIYRRKENNLLGVVANLRPAEKRAALARGTLDILGMQKVPVGIGSDGGSLTHEDTFSKHISKGKTGIDYYQEPLAAVREVEKAIGTSSEEDVSELHRIYEGQSLMRMVLTEQPDNSVSLLLLSSLKDAAMLLRSDEHLFKAKIKEVTIMGGMKTTELMPDSTLMLEPTDAHNNMFDFEAAKFFYRRCQELSIPLIVLSRFTAYGCPVRKTVYDLAVRCPVPNPIVCRLQRAQRESIETLWQNVCDGGKLPARCTKEWFCNTFCDGKGTERTHKDKMWDLVKSFNMYDPLALLAALPHTRQRFFDPDICVGIGNVQHFNIGVSMESTGIAPSKVEELQDFLVTTWIKAAGRPAGGKFAASLEVLRPVELDAEQLTAALTPMPPHSPEEMQSLNKEVLRLIDVEWPKLKNRPTTAGNSQSNPSWRDKDRFMRQIGPPMMLLDSVTVERLARIPHSSENKTITMEEAANIADREGKRFFIEMFSHRWNSPYAPDDRFHNKARVLVQWAKYRNSMTPPLRTFFWVDYCCIDQCDIAPGVAMLPLYVSCCSNIICYDTPPYEPRSWCRVERLMFSTFVAPNSEFIQPDFEYDENSEKLPNGELKPVVEGKLTVPDPMGPDSLLSYPADSPLIAELKSVCAQHWAKCWKDGLMDIVETKVGLKEVRALKFGKTQLRYRKFA
eukprot:TRINITY_DN56937_c0_g1_i1.p1 TRINITY_DN56937_c0_g1~~TRINITY_DN56937_c0_g1_i1.p1  ORF type:complete len:928 (+),score=150.89 TRINITY_DN56937_c0_g1_i1:3-2786(+)